jgi:hypothetical protein
VALVVRFDLGGVCRKIVTSLSGSPPLLPAGLQPRPRPAGAKPVSQSSRALRIWMIGTTLRLDGAPLSQFELARGLAALGFDVSVFVKERGPLRGRRRSLRTRRSCWR